MHPHVDALFTELLNRLGLDPETLPVSPTTPSGRLTVGASDSTPQKLWELHRIIDVVCAISANINVARVRVGKQPLPFRGIDLSAALGAYRHPPERPEIALVGSPLQLLEAVVQHGLPYHLGLFERDADVLAKLRRNVNTAVAHLGVNPRQVEVVPGDFTETASDWISRNVAVWMLGLMVVDVNAVFDSPELQAIAGMPELKHVDVALHLPAGMGKWPRVWGNGRDAAINPQQWIN